VTDALMPGDPDGPTGEVAHPVRPLATASALPAMTMSCPAGSAPPSESCPTGCPPDAGGDATAPHQPTHDCSPACGGAVCFYPSDNCAPGSQGPDAGACSSPPPVCQAIPSACEPTPTCSCLLWEACQVTDTMEGTCYIDADDDWVIGCLQY
jgi:hypothetical protein